MTFGSCSCKNLISRPQLWTWADSYGDGFTYVTGHGFSLLGRWGRGSLQMGNWAEIGHPHFATGWVSDLFWGGNIRSRPDLPPIASKTARLGEEQFYCCRSSCTGRRTADEHVDWTVGLIQEWHCRCNSVRSCIGWLRPVNNYVIIIIQSQHWHLQGIGNNNNLIKLIKGKVGWERIMIGRNNKEIAGLCLNLNSNNEISLILYISFR